MAIRLDGGQLLLLVKARPGAKVDRLRGIEAGALKVDVAAVAEDGRATEHLLGFLARSFAVARRDVELVAGAHQRVKRVRIGGDWRLPAEVDWPEDIERRA